MRPKLLIGLLIIGVALAAAGTYLVLKAPAGEFPFKPEILEVQSW